MDSSFFERPILNSPYGYPSRHRELDADGQPTGRLIETRRDAKFITPIPRPKKHKRAKGQERLVFDEGAGVSTAKQQYDTTPIINELRHRVDQWRAIGNPSHWGVTPETTRLLQHWRHHDFSSIRPFFCQIEAVETAIYLMEVAPNERAGKGFLDHLANANNDANPELMRLALKLATGAGKTTVMAMLIAWQTVNAVRRSQSKRFTRGFLVVTPGITIKDRLRVLQPNDPDSYYASRELVPGDMLDDVQKAKIVITNYHAFKLRERIELSRGGRALLQGRVGGELDTQETEGQMLQRVMPELMGLKNILVLNDEAHHCYREKPGEEDEEEDLKGDDRKEAERNREAARLWISGLEAVNRKLGLARVIDLSATPFFLRGSGYAEGTLFPWTMSDFSLMDAIECGIVKLPRVPVAENIPGDDMPMFRNLWENIRKDMPKKGRGKAEGLDPLALPVRLQTALEALYGHYEKTFRLWEQERIAVPPCFIVVCNNTSTSKLVYDYVSGFRLQNDDGSSSFEQGRLALFRNFDEHGNPLPRPNTLLIDSEQLESGEALDDDFRDMAADEIDRFRQEIVERTGDRREAENLSDQDLLREVMNTVGRQGRLGGAIRCVVSVSMLTEGWDANTVTHVLGVRAFGTQLLCEQVIGRALRRQSYDLNEQGLFNVEYADVLGVPFDFTAKPVVAPPQPPRETVQVKAMRPERDALEIRFPRVAGYRMEAMEARKAELTREPVVAAPAAITLNEYADRWLAEIASSVEPRTVESYKGMLKNHIRPAVGALALPSITRGQVKELLATKRAAGLSKDSVRLIRATISAIFADAQDAEFVTTNPASKLGRGRGRKTPDAVTAHERRQKVRAMTVEQLSKFLQVASGDRQAVLWLTLADTGMRPGEVFALRWDDVDLVGKTVHVQRAIERGSRRVKSTKTGATRYVDLTPRLAKALDTYQTDVEKKALETGRDAPDLVFPSDTGTPLDSHNVAKRFRAILLRAGLPKFNPYALRHSFASHLLAMGTAITYVSAQLGHAKPTMTLQAYAHYLPKDSHGVAEKLEAWRAQAVAVAR
jgi:type III restriction enzyme